MTGAGVFISRDADFCPISGDGNAYLSWDPSAIIDPSSFLVRIDNTNGVSLRVNAFIFNFRKRASEVTPLPRLLASLPRAASAL